LRKHSEREELSSTLGALEAQLLSLRADAAEVRAQIARAHDELETEGATLAGLRGPATRRELESQLAVCGRVIASLLASTLFLTAVTAIAWVAAPAPAR